MLNLNKCITKPLKIFERFNQFLKYDINLSNMILNQKIKLKFQQIKLILYDTINRIYFLSESRSLITLMTIFYLKS